MSMEVVNGYVCRNCTDVGYAKKGIDPAHPKDGPNGVDAPAARKHASVLTSPDAARAPDRGPAVVLEGRLSGVAAVSPAPKAETPRYTPGSTVNLSA